MRFLVLKAGWLRRAWNKVVPGLVVGVPLGVVAVGVFQAGSLRAAWEWTLSDGPPANFWQMIMGLTAVVATPPALIAFFHDQKIKRQAAAEELKIQFEEIDGDLMALYFSVIDDFLRYPELNQHHKKLDAAQGELQKLVYTKLIMLFAKAFRRLHGEDSHQAREQWYEWEDEIDDWVARPNFREGLVPEDLLHGEKEAFVDYMLKKKTDIPESADPTLKKPRSKTRSIKPSGPLGPAE